MGILVRRMPHSTSTIPFWLEGQDLDIPGPNRVCAACCWLDALRGHVHV